MEPAYGYTEKVFTVEKLVPPKPKCKKAAKTGKGCEKDCEGECCKGKKTGKEDSEKKGKKTDAIILEDEKEKTEISHDFKQTFCKIHTQEPIYQFDCEVCKKRPKQICQKCLPEVSLYKIYERKFLQNVILHNPQVNIQCESYDNFLEFLKDVTDQINNFQSKHYKHNFAMAKYLYLKNDVLEKNKFWPWVAMRHFLPQWSPLAC